MTCEQRASHNLTFHIHSTLKIEGVCAQVCKIHSWVQLGINFIQRMLVILESMWVSIECACVRYHTPTHLTLCGVYVERNYLKWDHLQAFIRLASSCWRGVVHGRDDYAEEVWEERKLFGNDTNYKRVQECTCNNRWEFSTRFSILHDDGIIHKALLAKVNAKIIDSAPTRMYKLSSM